MPTNMDATKPIESLDTLSSPKTRSGSSATARVWYLGYGSNMNPAVLTGRRRVHPARTVNVSVPGFKLTFQTPGLLYAEPCFASIDVRSLPQDSHIPVLHGVAFDITEEELQKIRDTEGMGYEVVCVNCFPITKHEQLEIGESIQAVTLMQASQDRLNGYIPSKRYRALLIDGGKHHNLPGPYQSWLESIPFFQVSQPGQHIGRLILVGLYGPAFLALFAIRFTWRAVTRQREGPPGVYAAFRAYSGGIRFLYECILQTILGNGGAGDYTGSL